MSDPAPPDLTQLLEQARTGDHDALRAVVSAAYDELRAIAHRQLSGMPSDGTLDTTAIVHEAFLKLAGGATPAYADRAHFFAIASKAMRQILVDHVRRRHAAKRGGDRRRVTIDRLQIATEDRAEELLALDEALERLSALNPRLTEVVECRFFGGLTEAETAAAMGVTDRTVRRDWVKARAWLYRELQSD